MKQHIFALLLGMIGVVVLDQFSKWLIQRSAIEPVFNNGIAFGIPLKGTIMILLNAVIILVFLGIMWQLGNFQNSLTLIVTILVLGGAIGNFIDRIMIGHVIDFIKIWKWPTFNIADTFISTGITLAIIFHKRIFKDIKSSSNILKNAKHHSL